MEGARFQKAEKRRQGFDDTMKEKQARTQRRKGEKIEPAGASGSGGRGVPRERDEEGDAGMGDDPEGACKLEKY